MRPMQLPVMPPVKPMLAKLAREMPAPEGMLYEPKWDGFRCIAFRDGDEVELGSRNEKPLTRYFPELPPALKANVPERCVLDGEIVIGGADGLDAEFLAAAPQRVSLSAMTLPHGLAQVLLLEQIYRAATILTGHPYHRE